MLVTVAKIGSAKENLVSFLEQLDSFKCSSSVVRMMPGLSVVLNRIKPNSMSVSWSWALDTVACHLRTCPTPENMGFEGKERLALDQTSEASECLTILEAVIDLIEALVTTVVNSKENKDNVCRKSVLLKFLLAAISHPLSSLNQHSEKDEAGIEIFPESFAVSKRIINAIGNITSNILEDTLTQSLASRDNELQIDDTCFGTFLYLLMGESIGLDRFPAVYTKLHLLRRSSYYIIVLLNQSCEIMVHKGLVLLDKLLSNVEKKSLSRAEAENPSLTSMISPLVNVIVYQNVAELRKIGFGCYSKYVEIFSINGRYGTYLHLLRTVNHSGLLGWTITSLKNSLALTLKNPEDYPDFTGHGLSRLVEPLYILSHGEQTDFLEVSDEVLSTINFTHFMLMRDKDNISGIKDLTSVMKNWTKQLDVGLKLSIAHYEQKLKEPYTETSDVDVTVAGKVLPAMSEQKMKEVVTSALHTFSLIQFNLVRVKELLDL